MMKYLGLATLLVATPVSAGDVMVMVRGPGMAPCSEILRQNWWTDGPDADLTSPAAYILGYVTASVNEVVPDLLPGGTNRDIIRMVFKQCQKNPTEHFHKAIGEVVDKLAAIQIAQHPQAPNKDLENGGDFDHHKLKPGEERF
jgi:hypothetical protein